MRKLIERLEEAYWSGRSYGNNYGGGYRGPVYRENEVPSNINRLPDSYPANPGRGWEYADEVGWTRVSYMMKLDRIRAADAADAAKKRADEKAAKKTDSTPFEKKSVDADAQKMITVLDKAAGDPVLSAAADKIRSNNDWKKTASEDDLKKIRHALYKRGMRDEANIFR